ncbi:MULTISPECIES: phage tail terminator-like protein [Acinetobacter calcoaceticus/baumannii complex]|uniref:phage tail terminator-like protein n=1 Tax=Acinetobacter calcoaceticus/baumannii complex TaxID=909768 RepID=UPI0025A02C00|nr:phage tail terminator-like protein [Acinetobacter baumannii]
MAMTLDQARQAIITRARAFTGIDQTRIKYPNKDFTVPVDGLWCEINVLWGGSIIAGIGDVPCTRRTGIISINCMARLNTHEVAITKLADAWLAHFEYFTSGQLEVLQGQVQNLGSNGDFIQYNISINYRVN